MYLRVKDGVVVVTTPYFVTEKDVQAFVQNNRKWIQKQMANQPKSMKTGDRISLLGKTYTVIEDTSFFVVNHELHITHDEKLWQHFLSAYAAKDITKRFVMWENHMGYYDIQLKFGFYKSKWGSCRKDKREIRLNLYLALCSWDEIDAIIVHELCHLKVSNHSQAFYHEVYRWMPNYDAINKQLKEVQIPKIE